MKSYLNPMVFHQGFPHIIEQIFQKLNEESIGSCRKVNKSWQIVIDNQNILWVKLVKKIGYNKALIVACKKGHTKIAHMIIQKSTLMY